ncbi:MAG: glycosyltransferase family 4 protein [Acidimicrobiales bacterium]
MSTGSPRVAVLWARLSGYVHASLRALADQGAEVLVFHREPEADAPFDHGVVGTGLRAHTWTDDADGAVIEAALADFDPHAVVINSWHRKAYRRAGRALRGRSLRILAMDNQWLGTPKQWVGVLTAPALLRPVYDAVFLPGSTQAEFARRLGFPAERTLWGLYSCDYPTFQAVAARRGATVLPEAFLFVGRLVPSKGVDVLAEAYRRYRAHEPDPWPLVVAGTGPEEALLRDVPGVEVLGFTQPDDLPAVYQRSGCLVLPSRFEPWAVVIHEAAAAGLPVVCSSACGASTRLVLDGYNGVVVTPGDAGGLAHALTRIHRSTDHERRAMSQASQLLARQFTPDRWARHLLGRLPELRAAIGLPPAPWQHASTTAGTAAGVA